MSAGVTILVNDVPVRCAAGVTVAAALMNVRSALRTSVTGEHRAPFCGMGTCHECRVTVDGVEHLRACMLEVRDGMRVHAR